MNTTKQKILPFDRIFVLVEAPPRFELGNKGVADLCLTTWPWRHTYILNIAECEKIFQNPQYLFLINQET